MKQLTPELAAALYTIGEPDIAHLLTFDFRAADGGTQRWSSAEEVSFGGVTWVPGPVLIGEPKVDNRSGLEVGTLELELAPGALTLGGKGMKLAALDGAFDRVDVLYQRGFFAGNTCVGVLTEFWGRVSHANPGSTTIEISVRSVAARLAVPIPRRTVQASCPYKFGDPNTCKAAGAGPCDKRIGSAPGVAPQSGDCRWTHNNAAHFGGFPFVPPEGAR